MSRGARGLPRLFSGDSRNSRSRRPSPPSGTMPCSSTHGAADAAARETSPSRARVEAAAVLMLTAGVFSGKACV